MDLSPDAVAVIGFVVLFTLMLLRVPVGMAMGLVGVSGFGYLVGAGPALKMVGQTSMRIVTDYTFGVIPMFLLMGAFVSRSGMSRELFRAANTFVGHWRGGLGIADDFRFASGLTDRPLKVSMTGAFSLSRRVSGGGSQADLVRALARDLHAEAVELAAAGARVLQVDEPFLAGYPEQVGLAIEALNIVTDVPDVSWVLHVCYGNRYARPLWEGHYDFLFPAVKDARIDQLALEFARRGDEELVLLERYDWDRGLGLGVIDVRSEQVETADLVAARIRRGLRYVPPERLSVNPDCGLRQLSGDAARGKLAALVAGAAQVRSELS